MSVHGKHPNSWPLGARRAEHSWGAAHRTRKSPVATRNAPVSPSCKKRTERHKRDARVSENRRNPNSNPTLGPISAAGVARPDLSGSPGSRRGFVSAATQRTSDRRHNGTGAEPPRASVACNVVRQTRERSLVRTRTRMGKPGRCPLCGVVTEHVWFDVAVARRASTAMLQKEESGFLSVAWAQ